MAVVAGPRVSNRAFAKPRPDPRRSRCGDLVAPAAALRDEAWIPGLCASGTGQNSELLAAVFTRRLDDDLKGFRSSFGGLSLCIETRVRPAGPPYAARSAETALETPFAQRTRNCGRFRSSRRRQMKNRGVKVITNRDGRLCHLLVERTRDQPFRPPRAHSRARTIRIVRRRAAVWPRPRPSIRARSSRHIEDQPCRPAG